MGDQLGEKKLLSVLLAVCSFRDYGLSSGHQLQLRVLRSLCVGELSGDLNLTFRGFLLHQNRLMPAGPHQKNTGFREFPGKCRNYYNYYNHYNEKVLQTFDVAIFVKHNRTTKLSGKRQILYMRQKFDVFDVLSHSWTAVIR